MLTIGDKQYRNLQEQVLQNQSDIQYILHEAGTLNEFGIKVVGLVNDVSELPDETTYTGEYGDAFAVGTQTPYTLYIWTRAFSGETQPFWFNIGKFPQPSTVPGPKGDTGDIGPIGPRGSKWYTSRKDPSLVPIADLKQNDQYLHTVTGTVWQYNINEEGVGKWELVGNIQGPQGIPGPQGLQGRPGVAGPQGPQGQPGENGQSFTIVGTLDNIDMLPPPTEENRTKGYLIGAEQPYDLYVVVGTDTLTWKNLGKVEGVTGPTGPMGPQGIPGENGPRGLSVYRCFKDLATTVTSITKADLALDSAEVFDIIYFGEQIIDGTGKVFVVQQTTSIPLSTSVISISYRYSLRGPKGDPGPIEIPSVAISAPPAAIQGAISIDDVIKLSESDFSYITFNKEIYMLMDKQHDSGYLVYTHVGHNTVNEFIIKCITITISTNSWVLTVNKLPSFTLSDTTLTITQ